MKVKDGVKIYDSVADVREFEPMKGEFYVFIFKYKEKKPEIFVEQAYTRNHGQFWNLEDAIKYAKFRRQEGDINSLFEKYERLLDVVNKVRKNLELVPCTNCKHLKIPRMKCFECE